MSTKVERQALLVVWVICGIVAAVGLWGWIWNIVKLVDMEFATQTGMMIVRAFGIVVPPLGAILGFV